MIIPGTDIKVYKRTEEQRAYTRAHYYKNQERYKKLRAEWQRNNPERTKENRLRYLLRHPERRIVKAAKDNAKTRNLEFNLEQSDIIIPEICPVFGIPFEYGTPYTASIDRIDNSKGYIKGNIQIISLKANSMKTNATREELIKFANWVLGK